MTLAQLLNTPAKIIRRSASAEEDAYGNEIPAITEEDVLCELQQPQRIAGSEFEDAEIADNVWHGFFPAGTELDTDDVVQASGIGRLEIVGDPWEVRSPRTQSVSHIEATLQRTAGSEDAT